VAARCPHALLSFDLVLVSIAYHQPVTRAGVSEILGREVSRDVIGALRDKT
jgi:segregation and condensation protein B